MINIKAILEEVKIDFSKVVKVNCYLVDMDDYAEFNEVYSKYFISEPARTCVVVKQLPLNMVCEVDVVAHLG